MLRLAPGVGYGSASEDVAGTDVVIDGLTGFFSLDLGGSIAENLVLHGRLSDMVVVSPTVSVDGTELGTAEDATLTFYLFGVGLTYYFMPTNMYLTGVIGIADARADSGTGSEAETKTGFGVQGDIGKEWWVSDNWGLGVAGRIFYASVPDGPDYTVNGLGIAALFSATYQ